MKPEHINALKAGIKTAISVFITSLIALIGGLNDALVSWASDGNPPDMAAVRGVFVAAVIALGLGLANSAYRFIQAAGVPFVGALLDKLLGSVPAYSPENTSTAIRDAKDPGADGGQSSLNVLYILVAVAALVALIIWISRNA